MNQRLPTGFPALDLILGGGLRREDLVVLGGDSGSGCSSLALGIAVRVAQQGHAVAMLSTEMSATRLAERALALSARATLDELAGDGLDDRRRVEIAEVALRLRDLPIGFRAQPIEGWPLDLTQVQDGWDLLVVDCLEGLEVDGLHGAEAAAARIASLKRLAIARQAAVLLVVHAGDARHRAQIGAHWSVTSPPRARSGSMPMSYSGCTGRSSTPRISAWPARRRCRSSRTVTEAGGPWTSTSPPAGSASRTSGKTSSASCPWAGRHRDSRPWPRRDQPPRCRPPHRRSPPTTPPDRSAGP